MSKNIKIDKLKIVLATFILVSSFILNRVKAMEAQPEILAQTDNGEEAVVPVENEDIFVLDSYSKKLENLKNNIQKNFNPTTCNIEKTREKIKDNDKTFEELKAEINKLSLNKKEKNNLEISIKEVSKKLKSSRQNFQEYIQKYSNQIEITEKMIEKYLNKINHTIYKINNFVPNEKELIFVNEIICCPEFQNLYNDFKMLYCLDENEKLNFNNLVKIFKNLNIINDNIIKKFNNPEMYNNNTINPDKNSENQLIENYFINPDLKNNLQKTFKKLNQIVTKKYYEIYKTLPKENINTNELAPLKTFSLPRYLLKKYYIEVLDSIKNEIIKNMSDEKLNSLLTEQDKKQYLNNQQIAITKILHNLFLTPSDELDSESVVEYFKINGNTLFSANIIENILNDKIRMKIKEADKNYLKEKLKDLQYSMDDVIEKFQQCIIKLDEKSPYEAYTIIFTIKTHYLEDILSNYNMEKTKNKTVKKENFRKILNIYKNILDMSCLLHNNNIDEEELNKHAKKLGIIKNDQKIKIEAEDLESIKNSFIYIAKKLKDTINMFCKKYKIDINKFKSLETNNYFEKYENEIAPPINNIEKEIKNDENIYFKDKSQINNNVINIEEDNKININEYNDKISNLIDEIDITKINEKNYEKLKNLIKKYEQNQNNKNNKNETNKEIENLIDILKERMSYIEGIKKGEILNNTVKNKNPKMKEISKLDKEIKLIIDHIENLYNYAYARINNEKSSKDLFEETNIKKIKSIIESTKSAESKNFKYKTKFKGLISKTDIEKYLYEIDNLIFNVTNRCIGLPDLTVKDVKKWLSNFNSLLEKISYVNDQYKKIKN